jgi:vitamin B12 transporter
MIRSAFLTTAFCVVALAPASARAQVRFDSLPVLLPTVSVTATGSSAERSALPLNVSVFSRAALRDAGVTHVADVLRLVPGATVLGSGSFGSQTSLFFRGGESDYVLVLVDGVPQNAPGGAYDFGALTIDNIERVEMVRGPGSVLYGSDAVTGVIQIFTRRGAGPASVDFRAGAGSFGTTRFEAGLSGGGRSSGWSLGAARHDTDGILAFNNEYRNSTLSGAWRWNGTRADAAASARFTEYTRHYPTNSAGDVVDSNAFAAEERLSVAVEGGLRFSRRVQARARATRGVADTRTRDLPDFAGDQDSYVADGEVTRDGLELRLETALGRTHTLTVSADHARDREESSSRSESAFGPFESTVRVSRKNLGGAVQLSGQFGARASYVLGVRLDDNSEFGDFTTLRVAGSHAVGRVTTIRASYGTAFKAPTFFENFATGFVLGNPDLDPERSSVLSAGIYRIVLSGRGQIGATVFSQRFKDLIQYFGSVGEGEPNYQNVGAAKASGLELESTWDLGSGLSARGSWTWLQSEVTRAGADAGSSGDFVAGSRLLRRPTHVAAAGMQYSGADGGKLSVVATYTGDRDDRDYSVFPAEAIVLDGFTRVDVALVAPLSRTRTSRGAAVELRVENALNAGYEEILGFHAPRRTLFVGVRFGR